MTAMLSAPNLEPQRLVELAMARTREAFVAEVGAPLLLVRLGERSDDLALALGDVATGNGARLEPTIGFQTVTATGGFQTRIQRARPLRTFGPAQVQVMLIRDVHFAVPLRKRADAGKAFSERISVGRARNNDIVLRNESVSKFHAWFGCDEDGAFYVADASSHNGTRVNSTAVSPGEATRLAPGDTLHVGSIEAVLCPAETLWEALHAAR